MYKKLECSLHAFLTLIWFLGCQWMVIHLLGFFLKMDTLSFSNYYQTHMYKINLTIQLFSLMSILLKDFTWQPKELKSDFRFIKKKNILYIGYGISLWFVSSLLNILLSTFFKEYTAQVEQLFLSSEKFTRFVVIVFLAPIVEEYFFRGRIQSWLKLGFGKWQAAFLQGIVFGIIHPFALQKIYASFLGIVLGLIKEKEGSLQSTILIHMTINCISLIIGTLSFRK